MFTKELTPLLSSEIADEMFPNISGVAYCNDNTFVATLRALLAPRMSANDTIRVRLNSRNDKESVLKGYSSKSEGALMLFADIEPNSINIFTFCGSESSVNASFDIIDNGFLDAFPTYESKKEIDAFFQGNLKLKARFFTSNEHRSAAIFIEYLDTPLWHAMQGFMSKYLPWYFDEQPLTEAERTFLRSITLKFSTEYEKLIAEYAEKYDFRSKRISKMLNGFESLAQSQRLEGILESIRNVESGIDRNVSQYMSYISQREELIVQRMGLEQQIAEKKNSTEIADYFIHNKYLNPINVSGSHLKFIVSSYLDLFDVDMFERYIDNPGSYILTGYEVSSPVFKETNARKKLLQALFNSNPTIKVKMCGYYDIDLRGVVDSERNYNYPSEYSDRIPNPHLHNHNCLGNYHAYIEAALRQGDTILAIEQCVASTKSVNIGEDLSFRPFLEDLFSSSCKKVIELPDGTSVTPTEAYNWLLEQENVQEVE